MGVVKTYRAGIAGASGLVGSKLLGLLQNDPHCEAIEIFARRPYEGEDRRKITEHLGDLLTEEYYQSLPACDYLFIAVGTTRAKSPDLSVYREVDLGIPLKMARYAERVGVQTILSVSSLGASKDSNNFYLRTKGQMERGLQKSKVPLVHLIRPSIILGDRQELRPAEALARFFFKHLSFLIPAKYRGNSASDIAAALLVLAQTAESPQCVEAKEIPSWALRHSD